MGTDERFVALARALYKGYCEETILALAARLEEAAEEYTVARDLSISLPVKLEHHQQEFYALGKGAIVCSCGFATTHALGMTQSALARDFFHRAHAEHLKRRVA